jgi:hypothetical protein
MMESVMVVNVAMRCARPARHSLAEEFLHSKNCNNHFLAMLGNDGELRPAFLDIKNRIARIPL